MRPQMLRPVVPRAHTARLVFFVTYCEVGAYLFLFASFDAPKKARIERAEQREREGHVPRPKVIQRKIQEGTGVKTALDSEKLPAAHGAYVAKNFPEKCAGKEYLPEDLNAMGFTCIPWDGM